LVLAGIIMERRRRKREGYVPMTMDMDKSRGNLERIPPETLLGGLGEKGEKGEVPKL